jgi:hypothetical protein
MNDTQKAPLAGRPGRTLWRWLLLVVLAIAGIVVSGCTSQEQKVLAAHLYTTANQLDDQFFAMDTQLISDIPVWNVATIQQMINDTNDMKRTWQLQTASATGDVRVAADTYTESIDVHLEAYESAHRFAQLSYPGFPKEATDLIKASSEPSSKALSRLGSLKN